MANSQSHIREIADKKTANNEGRLYFDSNGSNEHLRILRQDLFYRIASVSVIAHGQTLCRPYSDLINVILISRF